MHIFPEALLQKNRQEPQCRTASSYKVTFRKTTVVGNRQVVNTFRGERGMAPYKKKQKKMHPFMIETDAWPII